MMSRSSRATPTGTSSPTTNRILDADGRGRGRRRRSRVALRTDGGRCGLGHRGVLDQAGVLGMLDTLPDNQSTVLIDGTIVAGCPRIARHLTMDPGSTR